MLRVAVAGGLEQRTPAQVLTDIGVPALELATVEGDPNTGVVVSSIALSGSGDVRIDGLTLLYAGELIGGYLWTESGASTTPASGEVYLTSQTGTAVVVQIEGSADGWGNFSPFGGLMPWLDTPLLPYAGGAAGEITLTEVPVGDAIVATHLGQFCRVATADPAVFDWWQWNGTEWVFVRTDGASVTDADSILVALGALNPTQVLALRSILSEASVSLNPIP
jgi:hypothetical protein